MSNWFDDESKLYAYRIKRIEEGGEPTQVATYLHGLTNHIKFVQEAGRRLGVPESQLLAHDASKFSDEEFLAAVEHFHGGDPNPDRYARAWLHHIHANPHHWQYWMYPDGFVPRGSSVENGIVEMPYEYALEMVADWMGSSMAYTGSWDMADWLWKNMPRISLHSKTAANVRGILDMNGGYADVVFVQRWKHEQLS